MGNKFITKFSWKCSCHAAEGARSTEAKPQRRLMEGRPALPEPDAPQRLSIPTLPPLDSTLVDSEWIAHCGVYPEKRQWAAMQPPSLGEKEKGKEKVDGGEEGRDEESRVEVGGRGQGEKEKGKEKSDGREEDCEGWMGCTIMPLLMLPWLLS